jgi:hypothetical protein
VNRALFVCETSGGPENEKTFRPAKRRMKASNDSNPHPRIGLASSFSVTEKWTARRASSAAAIQTSTAKPVS